MISGWRYDHSTPITEPLYFARSSRRSKVRRSSCDSVSQANRYCRSSQRVCARALTWADVIRVPTDGRRAEACPAHALAGGRHVLALGVVLAERFGTHADRQLDAAN